MGVIIRQSLKGTVMNYVGVAIGFVTTFFVLTRCLTAQEIGLSRVLIDASMLFAGLAQLGTNASVMRFFPLFRNPEAKDHGFFFWTLVVPFVGFCLFAILFVAFKDVVCTAFATKSPLFVTYYPFIFPMAFAMLYMAVFETNANVLMRIAVPKFIREVGVRVLLLALYVLYAFDLFSIDGFVLGFSVVYGLATLLNIGYLLSMKRVSFKPDFAFITPALRREYALYTLFLVAAALGSAVTPYINTLFVTAKMGLVYTGVFSIATYVASIIEIPYRSLGAIAQPQLSQHLRDGHEHEAAHLCKDVSLHQFLAGSLLFFVVWINIDLFFEWLPNGAEYASGKWVIFILGLSKLVYATLNIEASALQYTRYYYASLFLLFLLTASAILLNNKLIPIYGMNGAALSSLFSYVLYYVLLIALVGGISHITPFSLAQGKVLVVVAGLFGLNFVWGRLLTPVCLNLFETARMGGLIDGLLRTCVLLATGVAVIYFWRVSPSLNALIHKVLLRKPR